MKVFNERHFFWCRCSLVLILISSLRLRSAAVVAPSAQVCHPHGMGLWWYEIPLFNPSQDTPVPLALPSEAHLLTYALLLLLLPLFRFATPMRTPRTAATGHDSIMAQAQNLARLQNMQTPLLGGANPELNPTDFTGVTPKPSIAATPNPLAALAAQAGATPMMGGTPGRGVTGGQGGLFGATPGRGAIAGVAATPAALMGATPGRGGGVIGSTPGQTPLRDELGLNEGEMGGLTGAKAARAQQVGIGAENGV